MLVQRGIPRSVGELLSSDGQRSRVWSAAAGRFVLHFQITRNRSASLNDQNQREVCFFWFFFFEFCLYLFGSFTESVSITLFQLQLKNNELRDMNLATEDSYLLYKGKSCFMLNSLTASVLLASRDPGESDYSRYVSLGLVGQ